MASLLGLPIGLGGAALMRVSNPGRDLYAVDFVVISLLTTLVLVALLGLLARPQTRSGTISRPAPPVVANPALHPDRPHRGQVRGVHAVQTERAPTRRAHQDRQQVGPQLQP